MSFETKESVIVELEQFTVNDRDLYRQQEAIFKNLATKKARGEYKHDLAVKAFGYLAEAGAKKYAKEFGGTWHQMFDVPTRRAVAQNFAKSFEAEYALGNYDQLLPKKYQKQEKASAHARKKITWRAPEGLKIAWSPVNQAYFALWPASAPVQKQQVLKIADADEMHGWLRDTYGDAYGRAGATGVSHSRQKSGLHMQLHDPRALRAATDRQLRGFYRDEKQDVAKARAEASRRGLALHARKKKSPSQLDREIADRVPSWRGGR